MADCARLHTPEDARALARQGAPVHDRVAAAMLPICRQGRLQNPEHRRPHLLWSIQIPSEAAAERYVNSEVKYMISLTDTSSSFIGFPYDDDEFWLSVDINSNEHLYDARDAAADGLAPHDAYMENVMPEFSDIFSSFHRSECTPTAQTNLCASCLGQSRVRRKCGRCGQYVYCSKSCQKAHWKSGHREQCSTPSV